MSEHTPPPAAYLVTLHGKVQGIGLRKRIQEAAQTHGVRGWVRNRSAGHVQAHLEGAAAAVARLLSDLQPGRIHAEVEAVVTSIAQPAGFVAFTIAEPKDVPALQPSLLKGVHRRAHLLTHEGRDVDLALREALSHNPLEQKDTMRNIALEIPARYLGEPLVQRQTRLPFDLAEVSCSFATECWAQRVVNRAIARAKVRLPEPILDDKSKGAAFARMIGLKVPTVLQRDVPLAQIDARPGIVVKPSRASSAKGVYSFAAPNRIYDLEGNKVLTSLEAFFEDARKVPGRLGRPDSWVVEELILNAEGGLPNDLKMLTFYGKVGLVQEETRLPSRFCYYDREGNRVATGRYENRAFDGTGVLPGYVELAEAISLKVPAPFLRIDFLKSADGPVFGEFTPKPGNFQAFDAATDARLGRCFADARGRLMADLMKGKRFVDYEGFLDSLKT